MLRKQYSNRKKEEKTRIIDEIALLTGNHRKHAIRLLCLNNNQIADKLVAGRRIYDEAIREALTIIWEVADRICGKRLKAVLPALIESMETHGHINLDPIVRHHLINIRPATIDRLLKPVRKKAKPSKNKRAKPKLSKNIKVRTFSDWDRPQPGYLEIDFVVHNGGKISGACIHTLAVTDICTGWVECIPLLAREQSLVVEGLEIIRQRLPPDFAHKPHF